MSEGKKPFTVSDRRHFTPQGEARGEDSGEEPAPPERPEAGRGGEAPGGEPESGPRGGEPAPGESIPGLDFSGLLISLAAQAGGLLAAESEAARAESLAGARAIIALLETLKEKTEGRRTPEEDEVMEGILYQLRMAYVAGTRKGGS